MTLREFIQRARVGSTGTEETTPTVLTEEMRGTAGDAIRTEIARLLWREGDERDRNLIRALIYAEMDARREADDGCGDTLYALCFLMFEKGNPEDVFLLYDAKHLNMDTGAMIDHDMLTLGRTRGEMLAFLSHRSVVPHDTARLAAVHAAVVAAFELPNHESPNDLREAVRAYFSDWDLERSQE